MDDFETRKQARVDNLLRKAQKAREESEALRRKSDSVTSAIPLGQPILVGHHSEKADRARREKAFDQWGKSIAAAERADEYKRRAEVAYNNTAIFSDDPEAVAKLSEKLANLEANQKFMVSANAFYRKYKTLRGFANISDDVAAALDADIKCGYSWEQCPFPPYHLQNNNANMKRVKERIAKLERKKETPLTSWTFHGGCVKSNAELNRLQLFFDAIPSDEIRTALKSHGFRWAPSEKAWQRQLTQEAIYIAKHMTFLQSSDC
jgi:hypothetical protein